MPVTSRRARVLFLSDTHLGLDLPARPRVTRRRRGSELFAAFEHALVPATRGEVDLVVHGGDVFFRSRVPPGLVHRVFASLESVADRGVPVCVVPGNHERSRIPHPLLAIHPGVRVFDRPRTFRVRAGGLTIALAGFPFVRRSLRRTFPALVTATGWPDVRADVRVLCLHQCIEGATVGPHGYVFRDGEDVIRGDDLPGGLAAVFAGHVHRHQVLRRDLRGQALPAPVLYAGSTERTSFAERDEVKGSLLVELEADGAGAGRLVSTRFRPTPTRPMVQVDLRAANVLAAGPALALSSVIRRQHPEAIVRLKLHGPVPGGCLPALRVDVLRQVVPSTMNVSVRWTEDPAWRVDT